MKCTQFRNQITKYEIHTATRPAGPIHVNTLKSLRYWVPHIIQCTPGYRYTVHTFKKYMLIIIILFIKGTLNKNQMKELNPFYCVRLYVTHLLSEVSFII